jgi:DNA replication protein DnaC
MSERGPYARGRLVEHGDERFVAVYRDSLGVFQSELDARIVEILEYRMLLEIAGLDDEHAAEHQLEVLRGEHPEHSIAWVKLTEPELRKALGGWEEDGEIVGGPAEKTIRAALNRLVDMGVVLRARATKREAYHYILVVARLNELLETWREAHPRRAKKRPPVGLALVGGKEASTGSPGQSTGPSGRSTDQTGQSTVRGGQAPDRAGRTTGLTGADDRPGEVDRPPESGQSTVPMYVGDGGRSPKTRETLPPLPGFSEDEVATARVRGANLPAEFAVPIDLDRLEAVSQTHAEAITAAREVVDGSLRVLVVSGGPGAGKSTIAAAVTWALMRAKRKVTWVDGAAAEDGLASHWEAPARVEMKALLQREGALVLDDLDAIAHDGVKRELGAAVKARLGASQPIVVTTELGPGELGKAFGGSTARRVLAKGRAIEVEAPDLNEWRRAA